MVGTALWKRALSTRRPPPPAMFVHAASTCVPATPNDRRSPNGPLASTRTRASPLNVAVGTQSRSAARAPQSFTAWNTPVLHWNTAPVAQVGLE